jgi:hypothetical protein
MAMIKTPCCKSDWYKKGRANLRCKECDADVTLFVVILEMAREDFLCKYPSQKTKKSPKLTTKTRQ